MRTPVRSRDGEQRGRQGRSPAPGKAASGGRSAAEPAVGGQAAETGLYSKEKNKAGSLVVSHSNTCRRWQACDLTDMQAVTAVTWQRGRILKTPETQASGRGLLTGGYRARRHHRREAGGGEGLAVVRPDDRLMDGKYEIPPKVEIGEERGFRREEHPGVGGGELQS